MEIIYLLHFSAPVRGASHYIGRTGQLEIRLAQHRKGQGARLTRLAVRAGLRLDSMHTVRLGARPLPVRVLIGWGDAR